MQRTRAERAGVWLSGAGVALLAVVLMLEGCQGRLPTTAVGAVPPDLPATETRVSVQSGSLLSSGGCRFDYDLYRSDSGSERAQIVLAHGFLRDRSRMRGLAQVLAATGWTTAAIDLCNMRPWDGAHRQNAADLRQAAVALGQSEVVYAGAYMVVENRAGGVPLPCFTASDNRYSTLRPPRPAPRTVTVVSPPDSSTQGGVNGMCRRLT